LRRRRKQKNPLLLKIIGASVLIHLIALPILAHYGTFQKVERSFINTELVNLPPPEKEKPPQIEKKAQPKHVAAQHAARSGHHAASARAAGPHLNTPHVEAVAANGTGSGDNGEGDVEQGSGVAGEVPTVVSTPTPAPTPTAADTTNQAATATPTPAPTPTPTVAPTPTPTPVYVDAVAITKPDPILPDSLRLEAVDKSVVAEFDVDTNGVPTNVTIAQSSGDDELDRIALATAKQWRFRPATENGIPTPSTIRLHIEFQVT
jgi:protein TonB